MTVKRDMSVTAAIGRGCTATEKNEKVSMECKWKTSVISVFNICVTRSKMLGGKLFARCKMRFKIGWNPRHLGIAKGTLPMSVEMKFPEMRQKMPSLNLIIHGASAFLVRLPATDHFALTGNDLRVIRLDVELDVTSFKHRPFAVRDRTVTDNFIDVLTIKKRVLISGAKYLSEFPDCFAFELILRVVVELFHYIPRRAVKYSAGWNHNERWRRTKSHNGQHCISVSRR